MLDMVNHFYRIVSIAKGNDVQTQFSLSSPSSQQQPPQQPSSAAPLPATANITYYVADIVNEHNIINKNNNRR